MEKKMNIYKLGFLGLGTVASGVVEGLEKNASLLQSRFGVDFTISKIAVRDLHAKRSPNVDPSLLTTDPYEVVSHPEVDIVLELIGGEEPARSLVMEALRNGKTVITANKALIAEHGPELFDLAEKNNTRIFFEASVAGGIPIIKALREGLSGNSIDTMHGILNGTCNYILSCMEGGAAFEDALSDAQKLGYAEADPTLDIDGFDAGHKAAILASLAYGQWFSKENVSISGIRNLQLTDINFARDAGYRIKLLANIKKNAANKISIDVQPTLVPETSMIGAVMDAYNGIKIAGNVVGETFFYGLGAGKEATSSAVIADIIDACDALKNNNITYPGFKAFDGADGATDLTGISCRFYLRVNVVDSPKVLAAITGILGDNNISIASITQKESGEKSVPVVILTHEVQAQQMDNALAEIEKLDIVKETPLRFRIEDIN
jgi:homoserine dehydrogenase